MKTLRKVTDRTPTAEGWYLVKFDGGKSIEEFLFLPGDEEVWIENIEYWYEPIDDIIKEMQAEIDYLKESKSAVRATKDSQISIVVKQYQNEAITFAGWIDLNFSKRSAGCFIERGTSDGKMYSIEELYNIFVNEPI